MRRAAVRIAGETMDYSAMADEDLMGLYYAGDDVAFAEIHHRYLALLTRAAFNRLQLTRIAGRSETADELSAQALIRAAHTREKPSARWNPNEGPVRPWLFKIVGNLATNRLRQSGHDIPTSDLLGERDSAEEQRVEELLTSDDLAPLARLVQEELQVTLRASIEELPEQLRQIVSMLCDGLSQTEIAKVLGISDATASRHRKCACARLTEALRRKHVAD